MSALRFGPSGALGVLLVPAAIVGVALTLARFARLVMPYLAVDYDVKVELGMVTGQVLFQWLFLGRASWEARFSYAWVLLAVSSVGAALLWPLLAWAHVFEVPSPLVAFAYFCAVVLVMFGAHLRLVGQHGFPGRLCATWIGYRLLLLLVLVKWSALRP